MPLQKWIISRFNYTWDTVFVLILLVQYRGLKLMSGAAKLERMCKGDTLEILEWGF
jgi:hypothetical protein